MHCIADTYICGNLTLEVPIQQNGQTHSNSLWAVAVELFECVWPFCWVGA